MDEIKRIIGDFQKKLTSLGFDQEQTATILYEVVLIASAKLSETDLTFLTPEEHEFVSNKDLMQLTPEQLYTITSEKPNLVKYLAIYSDMLKKSITEFDQIVEDVKRDVPVSPSPEAKPLE